MPNPTVENPNFSRELADRILAELQERLPAGKYPFRLEIHPRMTQRFGRWTGPGPGHPWHEIHLSAWLDDAELAETLRHEYAHARRGQAGHDPAWAELARQCGCQQINKRTDPPKLIPWKYSYRCSCGDVLYAVQIMPAHRRCRNCGTGRLGQAKFSVIGDETPEQEAAAERLSLMTTGEGKPTANCPANSERRPAGISMQHTGKTNPPQPYTNTN